MKEETEEEEIRRFVMMERYAGEKGNKGGKESILSYVPQATTCHHICIKPVSSSGRLLSVRKSR